MLPELSLTPAILQSLRGRGLLSLFPLVVAGSYHAPTRPEQPGHNVCEVFAYGERLLSHHKFSDFHYERGGQRHHEHLQRSDGTAGFDLLLSPECTAVVLICKDAFGDLIGQSLQSLSLGFLDEDDALVTTETELHVRVARHLGLACSGKKSALVDQLQGLAGGDRVLLRVTDRLPEWDVLARRHLERFEVIREQDLQYSPPSLEPAYRVVYESPSLVAEDLKNGRRPLVYNAQRRYCLEIEAAPPTRDFQRILVQPPELAA